MKLSSLTTNTAADMLCEIVPYVSNIVGDKELMDALSEKMQGHGNSPAEIYLYGAKKLASLVPVVFKKHKGDVMNILAVVNGVDASEIEKQNILMTIKQIVDLFKDKELVNFFKSLQQEQESA